MEEAVGKKRTGVYSISEGRHLHFLRAHLCVAFIALNSYSFSLIFSFVHHIRIIIIRPNFSFHFSSLILRCNLESLRNTGHSRAVNGKQHPDPR